ncbi:hypothetical protein LJR034_008767 [Caballeronia sp. LjRoot34]
MDTLFPYLLDPTVAWDRTQQAGRYGINSKRVLVTLKAIRARA